MTSDVWWYIMLSLSYYWSTVFSIFQDAKRKDFWEMLIHHIITILLIVFCWAGNAIRGGTLLLILHDSAGIFQQTTKMAIYLKWQRTSNTLFGIFTLTWIATRLGLYPFWIFKK